VPYRILFPFLLFFCFIGSYSINNSLFDVLVMLLFGITGYTLRKFGYDLPTLILAFVLGPLLENSLRQSLLISAGALDIFFKRSISATCLTIALFILCFSFLTKKRKNILEKIGQDS
jgi:putative tricarboxylic transport membrane protein